MKKKIFLIMFIMMTIMSLTGCKNNKYALEFKEEYESINGVVNKNGKEHRAITIDEDNPYIKTTPEEIVKMINNKETFFLYVGDKLCPWCRSVIEKSIEVAKDNYIDKVYYIDIWDDTQNEILRDKYELDSKNKPKLVSEGTESYKKLLVAFDKVLEDYTLTTDKGKKVKVGEKRIFAPNFFYIEKGEVQGMIDGIPEGLEDPRGELTEELLNQEKAEFLKIFSTACDEECGKEEE